MKFYSQKRLKGYLEEQDKLFEQYLEGLGLPDCDYTRYYEVEGNNLKNLSYELQLDDTELLDCSVINVEV